MKPKRSFEPTPGSIYPISQADGEFLIGSTIQLHLDTEPPASIEVTITETSHGFTHRIMAKIALHTQGGFLARINVLSSEPHSGNLSIDEALPNDANDN